MKKTLHKLIFCLFIFFGFQINAQTMDYKNEALKEDSNFYEIVKKTRQKLYVKSKQSKGIESILDKKEQKIFERWVYIWKDRVNADGTFPKNINKDDYLKLLLSNSSKKAKSANSNASSKATSSQPWTQIGPTELVNTNNNEDYPGSGRVDVVAIDPNDSYIMYVGTPSGGLWKTTDGGYTWAPKTDHLAGMGVTDILIDPNNSSILYMATGDRDSASVSSIGLFKSTDAGETWAPTGLTFSLSDNEYIRDIAFGRNSSGGIVSTTIFALTNEEIKRSTDSGATWSNSAVTYPYGAFTEKFQSIVFDPNDGNKVVVSDYLDAIYYSTDGGLNFKLHDVYEGGTSQKILRITASPADNDHFYGINQEGVFRKYRFAFTDTAADLISSTTISGFNSQQGYIQCIAVSPVNANNLMIGGVQGWKSTDNGATFSSVLNAYDFPQPAGQIHVHADHHFLSFYDGSTVVNGNDAGFRMGSFSPSTASDFPDYSSGLIITQSYNIAITQDISGDDFMMANQDNDGFSKVLKDGVQQWVACIAGDGTGTAIDYNNSNIRYLGGVKGELSRSDDGYASSYDSKIQILAPKNASSPADTDGAAFISPLTMHPTSSVTLYAGHEDVKKTTDKGANWTALNTGLVKTSFIEVVKNGASTHIYAIGEDGNYNKIAKTSSNESTWTTITQPSGTVINSFSAIPETNTVYASVSGYTDGSKVFKSTDNGSTWTNISSGLPNIVMKKVLVKTTSTNETLFVGTELGVYWKDDTMTNWEKLGVGLPNVIVNDLKINYLSNKLYIGTYGRGMWEINIQNISLKTDEFSFENKPTIFPNPVLDNNLNIRLKTIDYPNNYIIYNVFGGVVSKGNLNQLNNSVNLNNVSPGLYIIKISENKKVFTQKILVK